MFKKICSITLSVVLAISMATTNMAVPVNHNTPEEPIETEMEDGDSGIGSEPIRSDYYIYDPSTFTLTLKNPKQDQSVDPFEYVEMSIIQKTKHLIMEDGFYEDCKSTVSIHPEMQANLETVELADTIKVIRASSFAECKKLTSINLPDGLSEIGINAFSKTAITKLTLPGRLLNGQSLQDAFSEMEFLEEIIVPYDCDLRLSGLHSSPRVHIECTEGTRDILLNSSDYTDMSYSIIGQELLSGECGNNLHWSLDINKSTLTIEGSGEMSDYTNEIYPPWFSQRNAVKKIEFIGEPSNIGHYAFYNLDNLSDITIPNSVEIIGSYAFYDCDSLEKIELPESVTVVYNYSFANCSKLTEAVVTTNESVVIGDSAFDSENIKYITIYSLDPLLSNMFEDPDKHRKTIFYGYGQNTFLAMFAHDYEYSYSSIGYVITFDDSNDGGSVSENVALGTISKGVKINQEIGDFPALITEEGYEFIGWYTEKEGGEEVLNESIPSADMTLYARWAVAGEPSPSVKPSEDPSQDPEPSIVPSKDPEPSVIPSKDPEPSVAPSTSPVPGTKPSATVPGTSPAPSSQPSANVTVRPDGSKVETTVFSHPAGYVTTTEKVTKTTGEVTIEVVSTTSDKQKQTTVIMTIDATGQLKNANIDVSHVIKGKKMTINLNELKTLRDQIAACNTNYIYPIGFEVTNQRLGTTLGAMEELEQFNLGVTQKYANFAIKISAKTNTGATKYSVNLQNKDLNKNKYVVYRTDKKNNPVMVDPKKNIAKVNAKRDLTITINNKGNYQLQNSTDAAKTNKKIIKTVTPKKTNVTVNAGQKTSFKISPKCNTANIAKITYSANNSNVKVNKKGNIQGNATGNSKVTANVTMKNGAKKKIQMKVKVS